jgi:hypothetical protein
MTTTYLDQFGREIRHILCEILSSPLRAAFNGVHMQQIGHPSDESLAWPTVVLTRKDGTQHVFAIPIRSWIVDTAAQRRELVKKHVEFAAA